MRFMGESPICIILKEERWIVLERKRRVLRLFMEVERNVDQMRIFEGSLRRETVTSRLITLKETEIKEGKRSEE